MSVPRRELEPSIAAGGRDAASMIEILTRGHEFLSKMEDKLHCLLCGEVAVASIHLHTEPAAECEVCEFLQLTGVSPAPGHRRMVMIVDMQEPLDPSRPELTAESIITLADSHHPTNRRTMKVVSAYWREEMSSHVVNSVAPA